MAEDIFEQVAGELLFTPARLGMEDTQAMPAVTPSPAASWFEPAPPRTSRAPALLLDTFVADDGAVYVRLPADHFPPGGLA